MLNVIVTPHTAYHTERVLLSTVSNTTGNCSELWKESWKCIRLTLRSCLGLLRRTYCINKICNGVCRKHRYGKYQPFYIGITKSGVWKLCEKAPPSDWEIWYAKYPVVFSPGRNTHGFLIQKGWIWNQSVDVVFPMTMENSGKMTKYRAARIIGYSLCWPDIQSSVICKGQIVAYAVKNAGIEAPISRSSVTTTAGNE